MRGCLLESRALILKDAIRLVASQINLGCPGFVLGRILKNGARQLALGPQQKR